MTQLIIFDCDGTLIDSEPLSAQATALAMQEHGIAMDTTLAAELFTGLSQDAAAQVVKDCFNVSLDSAYLRTKNKYLQQLFEAHLQSVAGVKETLDQIDVPVCIGSNSDHWRLAMSLKCTGLDTYFPNAVYSAEDVAQGKPAPDLFLYTARQYGVAPEHCLVLDDSITGIQAAVVAGMTAIGFTGGSHAEPVLEGSLYHAGADSVISRFIDVLSFLKVTQS